MDIDSESSSGSHQRLLDNVVLHSTSTNDSSIHLSPSISDTDSIIRRLREPDVNSSVNLDSSLDDFSRSNVSMQRLHTPESSAPCSISNNQGVSGTLHCNRVAEPHSGGIANRSHHSCIDQSYMYESRNTDENVVSSNNEVIDAISQTHNDYLEDSSDEEEDFNDVSINEDEIVKNRFQKLDNIMNDEEYNEPLNLGMGVSKIEIILAIIKYCKKYHIPSSGIVDLFKMQNMFINKSVFPENRYQLDQLFHPEGGTEYHAVCPVCNIYLGTFGHKQRTIFCEVCDDDVNLKDPSFCNYFAMFDVEREIRNTIETNQDYYIDVISRQNKEPNSSFRDIYNGQKYKEFVAQLPIDRKESYATVTFNSDGSPIFKSSKYSIWPIQVVVNEVPLNTRSKKTITCALWFGRNKPNMTYFLRPFVKKMNELSEHGITLQLKNGTKKVYIYTLCCCVDAVARAPMQGIIQFNGYYGCNWCLHPGEMIRHDTGYCMKYPILDENPARRTANDTFRLMQQAVDLKTPILGVKNVTPLVLLDAFDVVDGFVPCPLHCVDKGVGKQITDSWLNSTNEPYSIPKNKIKMIDEYLKKIKVPTQLERLSRSISDRAYWKGLEWSNWILFYSIPILKLISREIPTFKKYVNHWSLLVEAYHILLQSEISAPELQRADVLLKMFVANTQLLYSADAMTYNIHQLLHLPQSVADWGPLYAHSGYVFESGNGRMKQTIYAAKGVLNQVCRYLSLEQSIIKLEKHMESKEDSPCMEYVKYLENGFVEKTIKFEYRYFGRTVVNEDAIEKFELPIQKIRAYRKVIKDGCVFKSSEKALYRSDNSFAILKNGSYISIQQFLVNIEDGIEYTTYKQIAVMHNDEISQEFHCTKKVVETNMDLNITETKNIYKACVYINIDTDNYISAVPNMYWE